MSTSARHNQGVPVHWGSPRCLTRHVGGFEITDAYFPPETCLSDHTHDRAVVAVVLDGAIESRLPTRRIEGVSGDVWTEPAGDRHSNVVGASGARVLVLQPDPEREDLFADTRSLLEGVHHFRHAGVATLARRVLPELAVQEAAEGLMMEGLAMQILAAGARASAPRSGGPQWLGRVMEVLHDRFRERLTLDSVALDAGVHPGHLTRVFKDQTGLTVGDYVRRLRLRWAADQLRSTDQEIGRIALRAGFADQSHFTRTFRVHMGSTPARYRKATRLDTDS